MKPCNKAIEGYFFCFKQKTAYEMRISDWSSDVCSSDLPCRGGVGGGFLAGRERGTLRVQHDAGDEEEGNCWDHDWNQGAHPGSPARKGREEKPARTAEGARRHARGTTTTRNGAGEHRDAPNVAYGPPTLRLACTVTPCWINDAAPLFCATIMIPAAAFELPFIDLDMSKLPALAEAVPPDRKG